MIRHGVSLMFMALCATFLALPIIVVCAAALNGGRTMLFPPQDASLQRFSEFFLTEPVWRRAMLNSMIVAVGSSALSMLLAWPLSYRLWNRYSAISRAIAGLAAIPFALPPIVFGVGLGFLWAFTGGLGTIWAGIISHSALFIAIPIVTLSIGLQGIDRNHLDAAATMGATAGIIFRTIILPPMIPFTVSGFFFVFVLSFNEFIVMSMVSASAFTTVTLQIFSSLRNGFTPTMAVAAISFILLSITVFSFVARFGDLPHLMGADQSREQ